VRASGVGNTAHFDQVTIAMRPHDCEWTAAPIGAKNCHYDARVATVRTAIARDGATMIVSHDEGKTWQVNSFSEGPAIIVSWAKVSE
jgi:hypothetical protein